MSVSSNPSTSRAHSQSLASILTKVFPAIQGSPSHSGLAKGAALLWAGAILIRLIAAIANYGFHGLDDYYIVSTSIPAQVAPSFEWKIENSGIRTPLTGIFVHAMGKGAYLLGLTDPLNQIRALYVGIGLLSLLSVFASQRIVEATADSSKRATGSVIAIGLVGFYWIVPLLSTRMLVETLATPFLMMSLLYATLYDQKQNGMHLVFSLLWLTVASMIRFQVGIVLPVLFFLPVFYRKWKDLALLAIAGLAALVGSGLFDLVLRGGFHDSLRQYFHYNINYSHCYGTAPFYQYIPIFIGLVLLPPAFMSRFKGFSWKGEYRPLLVPILFFALFFLAHSLTPRKEERFIFTIIPVFLLFLVPLLRYIFFDQRGVKRAVFYITTNTVLLFAVTLSIAQYSTVSLVRFLSSHTEIKDLFIYHDSLEHFPISYGLRSPLNFHRYPSFEMMEVLKSQEKGGKDLKGSSGNRGSGVWEAFQGSDQTDAQRSQQKQCADAAIQSGFIPTALPEDLQKKYEELQKKKERSRISNSDSRSAKDLSTGNDSDSTPSEKSNQEPEFAPSPYHQPKAFEEFFQNKHASGCDSVFVVRQDHVPGVKPILQANGLEEKLTFSPGFFEGIAVRLSDSNKRRGAMHLYAAPDCSFSK